MNVSNKSSNWILILLGLGCPILIPKKKILFQAELDSIENIYIRNIFLKFILYLYFNLRELKYFSNIFLSFCTSKYSDTFCLIFKLLYYKTGFAIKKHTNVSFAQTLNSFLQLYVNKFSQLLLQQGC